MAIKALSLYYKVVGERRKLQLSGLEELRMNAYENARINK